MKKYFLPIIMLPFIGSLMACQTIIYYEPKVPGDYNAIYLNGEIIYEENGIKFHYSCNSMTGKSAIYKLKPH
ncbi:MAG: hypothetical protein LBO65_03865, partial [Spirochaetaceae bacterium]|nr:hypothetical protein [Spirochaetaceae bacterium]